MKKDAKESLLIVKFSKLLKKLMMESNNDLDVAIEPWSFRT